MVCLLRHLIHEHFWREQEHHCLTDHQWEEKRFGTFGLRKFSDVIGILRLQKSLFVRFDVMASSSSVVIDNGIFDYDNLLYITTVVILATFPLLTTTQHRLNINISSCTYLALLRGENQRSTRLGLGKPRATLGSLNLDDFSQLSLTITTI